VSNKSFRQNNEFFMTHHPEVSVENWKIFPFLMKQMTDSRHLNNFSAVSSRENLQLLTRDGVLCENSEILEKKRGNFTRKIRETSDGGKRRHHVTRESESLWKL
jgi:hypothetical protein